MAGDDWLFGTGWCATPTTASLYVVLQTAAGEDAALNLFLLVRNALFCRGVDGEQEEEKIIGRIPAGCNFGMGEGRRLFGQTNYFILFFFFPDSTSCILAASQAEVSTDFVTLIQEVAGNYSVTGLYRVGMVLFSEKRKTGDGVRRRAG